MGRFLCLIFEDYNNELTHEVTIEDFKALINLDIKDKESIKSDASILSKFRDLDISLAITNNIMNFLKPKTIQRHLKPMNG